MSWEGGRDRIATGWVIPSVRSGRGGGVEGTQGRFGEGKGERTGVRAVEGRRAEDVR